ncbi:sensor histidine kinase [Bacillus sp. FJAT-28004]|uniref:HAMP domain-containing sensor histidine kinase n=1 Tax=Bacillus sp. FJAT-28004 TaxID=1679165 RepID=UPI0006B55F85|nr:HAMP domain-containing sensor histidine kinase [Bacillus sp. FJAT-28004]
MKLRSKIYLYSSVLFAGLLIAANVSVYFVFYKVTINRELGQLAAETTQAADVIRTSDNRLTTVELLRAYVPLDGMINVITEANPGNEPMVTSASETELSLRKPVFYSERQVEWISIEGKSYGFVSIPVLASDGGVVNVQVVQNMEEQIALLRLLRLVLVVVSAAVVVIALLSSGLLGSLIMRPIAAMTGTMKEVARSGRFVKLEQNGRSKDELMQMGETFNEMIGLLENSFARQEMFVAGASHELKTPLTIIESYSSLLKRRGLDRPDLFLESVEAIHSEAVRMKGMTEQLLLLAIPHRQWKLAMETMDLLPFAEQAVSSFRRAYNREVVVQDFAGAPVTIMTDADKLKQLLFILLDNARKYSSGTIFVQIDVDTNGAGCIRVVDSGIGISQEELPHVFEQFYRVDEARNRGTETVGGAGLGLSLAKEITFALGAHISLESVEGKGTSAVVSFPKTNSAVR